MKSVAFDSCPLVFVWDHVVSDLHACLAQLTTRYGCYVGCVHAQHGYPLPLPLSWYSLHPSPTHNYVYCVGLNSKVLLCTSYHFWLFSLLTIPLTEFRKSSGADSLCCRGTHLPPAPGGCKQNDSRWRPPAPREMLQSWK